MTKKNPANLTMRNLIPLKRELARLKALVKKIREEVRKLRKAKR